MLTTFPAFLTYSFFAPLLIRLAAGSAFISFATPRIRTHRSWMHIARVYGVAEVVVGVMLITGYRVQVAALVGVVLCGTSLVSRQRLANAPRLTVVLTLLMCLSLVVSGAGALAFDLPL